MSIVDRLSDAQEALLRRVAAQGQYPATGNEMRSAKRMVRAGLLDDVGSDGMYVLVATDAGREHLAKLDAKGQAT
jgi:hypothetical protein